MLKVIINKVMKEQNDSAGSKTLKMYHGSPYTGIKTFDDVEPPIYFTMERSVALYYSQRPERGALGGFESSERGFVKKPTIYHVEVSIDNLFDMRNPEHAKLYDEMRRTYNITAGPDVEDQLPSRKSEGFIIRGTGLPSQGPVRSHFQKLLQNTQFDSTLVDEGSHGISLALFKPKGKVKIINIEEVS